MNLKQSFIVDIALALIALVAWGALHGIYLIIERMLRGVVHIKIGKYNGILLALLTYTCVNITWVFFRATDFDIALGMIKSMFFMNPEGALILGEFDIFKVMMVIAITFLCHWFMRNTSMKEQSEKLKPITLGIIWAVMLFMILISQGTGEQFIYFQF